jgi:hypothetical protein
MSIRARLLLIALLATASAGAAGAGALCSRTRCRAGRRHGQRLAAMAHSRAVALRKDPGHGAAALRPGARARPGHRRPRRLLGLPVRGARGLPAVHRHPHHPPRRPPVLRFAAQRPRARPATTATTSGARSHTRRVVLEPTFGRLTGHGGAAGGLPGAHAAGRAAVSCCWRRCACSRWRSTRAGRAGRACCWWTARARCWSRRPMSTGFQVGGSDRRHAAVASLPSGRPVRRPRCWPDGGAGLPRGRWPTARAHRQRHAHARAGRCAKDAHVAAANRRFAQDIAPARGRGLGAVPGGVAAGRTGLRRQVTRITRMAQPDGRWRPVGARIAPPLPRGELGTLMTVLNHTAQSLQAQRDDIARLNNRLRSRSAWKPWASSPAAWRTTSTTC